MQAIGSNLVQASGANLVQGFWIRVQRGFNAFCADRHLAQDEIGTRLTV